jgi:hypothetical protein
VTQATENTTLTETKPTELSLFRTFGFDRLQAASALVDSLRSMNFRFQVVGDRLHVQPRDQLAIEDCDAIRDLKPEIMDVLAWHQCSLCGADCDTRAAADIARLCHAGKCPMKRS